MKSRAIRPRVILVMTLALAAAAFSALWHVAKPGELAAIPSAPASGFSFSLGESCNQDFKHQPLIEFSRDSRSLRARVSAVMNCSYRATDPQVLFTPQKVTLVVEESPSVAGYAAACLCAKPLVYDLYRPISAGTLVVLQQAGEEVARARAP